jgi:molybdopterin synthase sulfur carrier subunit
MIRILYFARLKEALGVSAEDFALPYENFTVHDLMTLLASRGEVWQREFGEGSTLRAAINYDVARHESILKDGEEVAFFPPVTGG